MAIERDAAIGVFGGALTLAGLLLVFIGFLLPKTDAYNVHTGDKFRRIARAALIPFMACLACSWFSIWAIQGAPWSEDHLWGVLKATLVLTGIYAIIATAYSTT